MINLREIWNKPSLAQQKEAHSQKMKSWESDTKSYYTNPQNILKMVADGAVNQFLGKSSLLALGGSLLGRKKKKKKAEKVKKSIPQRALKLGSVAATSFLSKSTKTKLIIAGAVTGVTIASVLYFKYRKPKKEEITLN